MKFKIPLASQIIETVMTIYWSKYEILNQISTPSSKKEWESKQCKNKKNHHIASSTIGSSIQVLYLEAMLFPSKFWVPDT